MKEMDQIRKRIVDMEIRLLALEQRGEDFEVILNEIQDDMTKHEKKIKEIDNWIPWPDKKKKKA